MPMAGVRCPFCAENGQEVWVIPGKSCGYCGTICSDLGPGMNPYPSRNIESGDGSSSPTSLSQTQRIVSTRSTDMRRMDYIFDEQIYRKLSQQGKLLSVYNSRLDVEDSSNGTNLWGSGLSSQEKNETTDSNLEFRPLEDAVKSIEEAMNASNQESLNDLEEEDSMPIEATEHSELSTPLTVALSDVEHRVKAQLQPTTRTSDRLTIKLTWKCTCGHESMDLFPLTTRLEIQEHAEGLMKAGYIKSASISTSSPSKLQITFTTINNILIITSNKVSALIYKIKCFIAGSRTADQSPERLPCIVQGDCRWLHICVKRSIHATSLEVIHLCSQDQQDDPAVFKALRNVYKSQRSKNTWISKVQSIDFVKFEARHDNLVDQIQPNELPTSLKSYDFAPPPPMPPIGRNHMMHLFSSCPSSIPAGTFYIRRLPKKKDEPVSFCADNDEDNVGWGLHFVEGLNHAMITYVMFGFTLIVGLVFGVCWTVLRHDVQDAWTISAWITAVMTLGLMAWQSRATDWTLDG